MAKKVFYNDNEVPADGFLIINGSLIYITKGADLYINLILLGKSAKATNGKWLVDAEIKVGGICHFIWDNGSSTTINYERLNDFYKANWPTLITCDKARTGDVPGLVIVEE